MKDRIARSPVPRAKILIQSEVIGHGDRRDRAAAVAYHHVSRVSILEELVLCQRAVQAINCVRFLPLELTAEDFHPAALLTAAHQSRIHNIALVGFQHQRPHAICVLVAQRTLISGG